MTNRINELEKSLPKTKESFDALINSIASYSNIANSEDDEILSAQLDKLDKIVDYLFKEVNR